MGENSGVQKVTKKQIILRGLRNRCPNCGRSSLFEKGVKPYQECPSCGVAFERGEGFYMGAMCVNYGITILFYLIPLLLLAVYGVIETQTAVVLGVVGSFLFPLLFYRPSRSWWIMSYFYFLPQELPANRPDGVDDLDPDEIKLP